MNDEIVYRRLAIDEALAQAPNQWASRFEHMLLSMLLGDFALADQDFKLIRARLVPGAAERRVKRILQSEVSLSMHEGLYFVGEVSPENLQACMSALAFLRTHSLKPNTLLVLDCSGGSELAAAFPVLEGVTYICLSGADTSDFESAAVHELAHACLMSENRFLDEGVAHYLELEYRGCSAAIGSDAAEHLSDRRISARIWLAYDADDDPFFELMLPGNNKSVHQQASRFFEAVHTQLGARGVSSLFNDLVASGPGADAAGIIERTTGLTIEQLELRAGVVRGPRCTPDATQDESGIRAAFVAGDMVVLTQAYESILKENSPVQPQDTGRAEQELVVIGAVAANKSFKRSLTRYEIAFFKSRFMQYHDTHGKTARLYLFRALMSIAAMSSEGSMLDAIILLDEAKTDLELAMARYPDDPFVLACLGRLEWYSPKEMLGGRARALELFRRIAAIPGYAAIIRPTIDHCEQQHLSEPS
jgi:hypothetical protein